MQALRRTRAQPVALVLAQDVATLGLITRLGLALTSAGVPAEQLQLRLRIVVAGFGEFAEHVRNARQGTPSGRYAFAIDSANSSDHVPYVA